MTWYQNYLAANAQPWARQVQKKIDNLETTFRSAEVNNLKRDDQLASSLRQVSAAAVAANAAAGQAQEAADKAQGIIDNIYVPGTEEIDGAALAENTINGMAVVNGTLPAGKIQANTITATQISTSYVYAGQISAGQINAGTVTGLNVSGGSLSTTPPSGTQRRVVISGTEANFYDNGGTLSGRVTAGEDDRAATLYIGSNDSGVFMYNGGMDLEANGVVQVVGGNGFSSAGPITADGLITASDGLSVSNGATISGGATVSGVLTANGGLGISNGASLSSGNFSVTSGNISASGSISAGSFSTSGGITANSIGVSSVGFTNSTLSQATDGTNRIRSNTGFLASGPLGVTGDITYVAPIGTGTTFPLYWNSSTNLVYRLSSSERYKTDIRDAEFDYEALLAAKVRTFRNKQDVEQLGAENAELTYGYIAEELHDLGLTDFVVYQDDEDGTPRPESVNYMSMALASHAMLKAQHDRLSALEARLEALEAK